LTIDDEIIGRQESTGSLMVKGRKGAHLQVKECALPRKCSHT